MSTPVISPLFLVLNPSGVETPGISWVSCTKLRPFSGSSRTCSPVTSVATSPPTVSTVTESAETVTWSSTAPTSSWTSKLRVSATLTWSSSSTTALKPSFSTTICQLPGGTSPKT